MIALTAADPFGGLRGAAVQQHDVGVLGVDLVEPIPNQPVIVKIKPPVSSIFGPGGSSTSVSAQRLLARE